MKNFILSLFASCLPLTAQDWPGYLNDGTGITTGSINSDWKAKPPKTLWKKKIGKGCSGFAIVDNRAIVAGNDGKNDTWWCFDASSGDLIWKHSYQEELAPKYYTGGPNCTPTIHQGLVYTLSKSGKLFALKLTDGSIVWQKDLKKDYGGKPATWGFAAAPTLYQNQLLILPSGDKGALYALDPKTGSTLWHNTHKARAGYSAPAIFNYKGKDTAFVFHGRQLIAYDLENKGKELFSYGWRTSYDVNASNPQLHDDKLFLAAGYGMGYMVIDVKTSKPKELHRDRDLNIIFQNTLLLDGDIVSIIGDKNTDAELIRMDLATGKFHWRKKMPGTRGSSLMVGDTYVGLLETGEVFTGKLSKTDFTETGRIKTNLTKPAWAPISSSNGRLFIRDNKGNAACLDVSL